MSPLKVATEASQVAAGAGTITSDRRLFLAQDEKTLVEEGHADARYLLVPAGGEIPPDKVKQLGLKVVDGKVAQSPEDMAEAVAESQSALQRMAGGDMEDAKKQLEELKARTLREAEAKQAGTSAAEAPAATSRTAAKETTNTKEAAKPEDKSRTATEDKSKKKGR